MSQRMNDHQFPNHSPDSVRFTIPDPC